MILLVTILFCSPFINQINADSAWFQVCDTQQKLALNSLDCELGLWLKEPIYVDCVCVNGVWIVSQELCDYEAMILVGKGDCFTLRKEIRSVKLLGAADNPFKPATYVASETLDTIEEVPRTGYNEKLPSPSSIIISVYPRSSLRRSDHQICLSSDSQKYSRKPVYIWKNSRRVSSRFKFVDRHKCESTTNYDFNVGFGEIYQASEISDDSAKGNCAAKCLVRPETKNSDSGKPKMLGRFIGRSEYDAPPPPEKSPRINWAGLYALNKPLEFTSSGRSNLTPMQRQVKMNWYKFRWNTTMQELSHARETREQSVRMIQAQTSYLLFNDPPPKIDVFEYDYFQKLRQIFVALAPPDIIDPNIVNGLMRMFRLLLWESHNKFEFQKHVDLEQHYRVMKVLNDCVIDVAPYPMVFTNLVDKNENTTPRANSTHNCLDQTIEVYWNSSQQKDEYLKDSKFVFLHTTRNVYNETDGENELFDPKKFDFVIELAWKIYLFGFYRCQHLFEEKATEAHELAAKVMSLFNQKVIKRWYSSEDFNSLLGLLFPKLNQTEFSWAVDKLTIAARESWNGVTFMQRKPVPVTQPDIPADDALRGFRNKRRSISSKSKKETFWNNRAHCMLSYSDPIKLFKYSRKQDCYT